MKNKKMTKKEFLETFENAGFSFEIWGYEGILNMISGYTKNLAEEAEKNGSYNISTKMIDQSKYIESELTKRGYYDKLTGAI